MRITCGSLNWAARRLGTSTPAQHSTRTQNWSAPAPQSGVGERRRRRWYGTSPSCCWSEKTPDSSDAALSSSSSSSSPSLEYSESASDEEEGVLSGAALRSSPCGGAPLCDSLPVVVTRPCQKRAACERERGGVSESCARERKISVRRGAHLGVGRRRRDGDGRGRAEAVTALITERGEYTVGRLFARVARAPRGRGPEALDRRRHHRRDLSATRRRFPSALFAEEQQQPCPPTTS